jgi:hypothetical protein
VPGQIHRAFRNSVRTIIAFIWRNCVDNALRDAMLVFESRQINTMEQEGGMIGLDL